MKKYSRVIVCANFKDMNKACLKDEFPQPNIRCSCCQTLQNKELFSFIDGLDFLKMYKDNFTLIPKLQHLIMLVKGNNINNHA